MKKLLFSAIISLLFISSIQASILSAPIEKLSLIQNECSSQISIVFKTMASLSNLTLNGTQQVLLSDGNRGSLLANLTVTYSFSAGSVLHVDFSSNTNLNNWIALTSQQLEFVHSVTGATTTVSFIIIEQIIH